MLEKTLLRVSEVPANLLANLASRDVALWICELPHDSLPTSELVRFVGLPWKLVLTESYDNDVIEALLASASIDDPMTRKRGFVHVIEGDPSQMELPDRCLPVYLLNGRRRAGAPGDFNSKLRRMTMLDRLRRSGVRELLVLSGSSDTVPADLGELWEAGFRSYVTFASDAAQAGAQLQDWVTKTPSVGVVNLVALPPAEVLRQILQRYFETYPEDRRVLRLRDVHGKFHRLDVTELDEPERPILEWYSLIEERDLHPLMPAELPEKEFVDFFRFPGSSWKPYAAGLPWIRSKDSQAAVTSLLKRLDADGSEANRIAYISAESGSGGTTLARSLAWQAAREGYPTLIAKSLPFVPDALPVVNFLSRVHAQFEANVSAPTDPAIESANREASRRYEAPWLIVFDTLHWQYRDSELVRFRAELEKAGRPVCLLVVTGPVLGLPFYNGSLFREIAELNHAIDLAEAQALGDHLNRFLRGYGKQRKPTQWAQFYDEHTVRYLEGTAAFWVTLSFWIQGEYDLSESIQEWMFRCFKEHASDPSIRDAVLRIAALSSERLPLPEALLPQGTGRWPISHMLADARATLASLGLIRVSSNGEKHWALVHDILGRFLINALFYDFATRDQLGLGHARDAEHLRFLLLEQVSREPLLGERAYRTIGEDFATAIFKVDPGHGHGGFASLWKEVLAALDKMPQALRDTSRVFRHHTAVSRRRIARLDARTYDITNQSRIQLLNDAIGDINYALNFIPYTPGSEPNLNLLNSLANAYFDLAEAEAEGGATRERIAELRELANEATRRAYAESPANSFVIETYVKNLLHSAKDSPERAVENCVEALGILFSALTSDAKAYRASQLGNLADQALGILLQQDAPARRTGDPKKPIDVLLNAWSELAEGIKEAGFDLSDVPEPNRRKALEALAHPAGRGNVQVIRLSYDLTCATEPLAFKLQLQYLEQLQGSEYRLAPQLRLEYAILLFQAGRHIEGDKAFKSLRVLWRDSEHFVQVPDRLRWLRAADTGVLQTVHATTGSDYGNRALARVQEFGGALVPFRPEEHGMRDLRPGTRFTAHVSFGHNGPFLRPVTARPVEK